MLLIVLAVCFGVGVTLLIAGFAPARPELGDVMRDRAIPLANIEAAGGAQRRNPFADRVLRLLERVHVSTPDDDLELVGQSREAFLLQRVGLAAAGAAWLPLLSMVLALIGVSLPVVLTAGASLGAAAVGWLLPSIMLRSKVKEARAVFLGALASYFELVALGRLGDRGPVEALDYPARLGKSWAFRRIRLALEEASRRGEMPWDGLERLARQMGVRELRDLGQIITTAGKDGASIVATLRAKAQSIREAQMTAQRALSSVRSDRMDLPLAFMSLAFIVFLAFPGVYQLVAS